MTNMRSIPKLQMYIKNCTQTTLWKIYWQLDSIEVDTNGCLRAHKVSLLLICYIFAQYY